MNKPLELHKSFSQKIKTAAIFVLAPAANMLGTSRFSIGCIIGPFFHAPITSNSSLTTLFLDVNIADYYTNRAPRIKRPRFNQHLQNSPKAEFSTCEKVFWDSRGQEHTIQNTSLPSQPLVVPPQAITALSR